MCVADDARCAANQFQCKSGQCLKNVTRCNKKVECKDGTDEIGCYRGNHPIRKIRGSLSLQNFPPPNRSSMSLKKQLLITQQKLNHFKLKANLGKAILSSRLCFVQLFSFRGDSKMPKPQKSTSAYIYLIVQCYYWLRVLCDRVVFSSSPLSLSGSLKLKSKNKVESRT